MKKKIDFVLNLVAPEEVIVERLTQRRHCGKCGALFNLVTVKPKKKDTCDKCGSPLMLRKDDEPETVRKRIQVYSSETSPVIDYYRKRKVLVDVDATKRPKEVFASVVKILGKPEKTISSEKVTEK